LPHDRHLPLHLRRREFRDAVGDDAQQLHARGLLLAAAALRLGVDGVGPEQDRPRVAGHLPDVLGVAAGVLEGLLVGVQVRGDRHPVLFAPPLLGRLRQAELDPLVAPVDLEGLLYGEVVVARPRDGAVLLRHARHGVRDLPGDAVAFVLALPHADAGRESSFGFPWHRFTRRQ
jgi:hypothetical protein